MPSLFWLVPGVLLPLAALVTELAGGWCAQAIFDPIPSWIHGALIALVPLANYAAWRWLRREAPEDIPWARVLLGASLAISLFYAILFLPVTPIAFLGLMWF